MATAMLRPVVDDRPSVLSGEREREPTIGTARGGRGPVNALQFARSIVDAERRESARQMRDTVASVKPEEFSRLIQVLAKLKARYATMILELGRAERVGGANITTDIRLAREQIHEIEQGLAFLRQSVIDGEIKVIGVAPPPD